MNTTATLTPRESQIAELLAWGCTVKDAANTLDISRFTVINITRSIYEKAGVTKVNELSAWWFCTRFNIPTHLSPIGRGVIAGLFLALVVTSEVFAPQTMIRPAQTRTIQCRASRGRRNDNDYTIEL